MRILGREAQSQAALLQVFVLQVFVKALFRKACRANLEAAGSRIGIGRT